MKTFLTTIAALFFTAAVYSQTTIQQPADRTGYNNPMKPENAIGKAHTTNQSTVRTVSSTDRLIPVPVPPNTVVNRNKQVRRLATQDILKPVEKRP